jgi:ADP-ribose pyrophosphatase YjhB (NUDIX family)
MTDSSSPSWYGTATWLRQVPPGDDRTRLVCGDCGFINYQNPRVVTGAVATWENRFLLAKRAIEPRKGYWTIPAGFLELEETVEVGAVRETWEEARARIAIDGLIGVYSVARIGQIHIIFRGRMLSPAFAPGPESEAVDLFSWDEIPWADLAFPVVQWSLQHFREMGDAAAFSPRYEPPAIHWER